ncbi:MULTISPECIES: response regulator transcription factor [Bacteroidota]|uniref:Response regulator transcription factor n=2 Tax=Flectobacillus TaxID=101 RepID=A0ABT6YYH7_9BACT|nr:MULTISPECIES: response regulator transcription factor [Bacteroidota]NBA74066.1 response regulator [Emticicia sp. ODNR4P]MDI9858238.1 response regulator transcription factor [Flectobacillus roseus]MDI9867837.1 response regulator transcription factor [Flectobacillus roseus]MDI9873935.1 response regulator transcription factor [Flectobacillus rivi]NBB29834.1 response regulator [Cellulophaga sp. BC115SP]
MIDISLKVLVVDDDPDILELLQYNLEGEGYQVFTAENGKIAVEKAKQHIPDLIVMDIMMPIMDGIEAGRIIKQMPELNKTYLLFLTARAEEYSEIAAFDIGADDYIIKPVKPRALLSRIKAMLKRELAEGTGTEKIVIEDLTINKQNYSIAVNNNSWVLPKKEFDLLMFFVTNPNKVYSRDEILSNVWGRGIHVTERTVDVHIRKIREKIGDDYIRTIKGVGYLFANA